METVIIKFLFLGFLFYHSVSATDSLLSPKGVNYEGGINLSTDLFLLLFSEIKFLTLPKKFVSCSGCFNVSEEQDER